MRLVSLLAAVLTLAAQSTSPLAGIWSLNRAASQFPREIGFNVVTIPADDSGQPSGGGGRGRRNRGRAADTPFSARPESYEDAQRRRILTDEVRTPPARLMIVDSAGAVTITNELGQSRILHATGLQESLDVEGVALTATTTRDGTKLVVVYHVEPDRDVRYIYTPSGGTPGRLTVETQFLDHGAGDKVTRVYDAGESAADTVASAPPAASAPPSGAATPPGLPGAPARESFDERPGAEFKGLKDIGVLVEDLGPEAAACGLRRDAIESDLAQRLSAGGLNVKKNSDEDTYVYVNIITTSMPTGVCVSRYDAFLYTHTTAKLAYGARPVLVQVSLMHRGGLATSGPAAHAAAVTRGLDGYVDLFLSQIRDANK